MQVVSDLLKIDQVGQPDDIFSRTQKLILLR